MGPVAEHAPRCWRLPVAARLAWRCATKIFKQAKRSELVKSGVPIDMYTHRIATSHHAHVHVALLTTLRPTGI
eukprot:5744116-Pyramimonas_sp.AAC.1